MKVEATSR